MVRIHCQQSRSLHCCITLRSNILWLPNFAEEDAPEEEGRRSRETGKRRVINLADEETS